MPPLTVLWLGGIVGLTAYAWRYDMLRSWRTLAIAAIVSLLVIAFSNPLVQVVAVAGFAALVLTGSRALWAMREPDWRYVQAHRRALRRIEELPAARVSGVDAFRSGWTAIAEEMARTDAPDDQWRSLRDETVSELRRREKFIDRPETMTPDELVDTREKWAALESRLESEIENHLNFWLLAP